MSEVMTLEGLDGSAGSTFVANVGKGLIAEVAKDPQTRAWLKRRGYEVAKAAIRKATLARQEEPPPIVKAIEPLLDPLLAGMAEAVKEYVAPLLVKASLLVAGGGVFVGWLVGRAHRPRP